jgi:hypothetical protein
LLSTEEKHVKIVVNKGLMMALNGLRRMRAYAVFQASRYIWLVMIVIGLLLGGFSGEFGVVLFSL